MCPLRWLWIRLPGTRRFDALHYTHPRPVSQLEIFISTICFSDAPPHPLFDDWPVTFGNSSLCSTYVCSTYVVQLNFVQPARQRIMPCGMANSHPGPNE